jgi:hypothetical protein
VSRRRRFYKIPGEEQVGGAFFNGVGQVDDDDIVFVLVFLQVGTGVGMVQLGAPVLDGAPAEVGQVLAADLRHGLVDLHHHRPLDRGVPQYLAEGGAFAAAGDEDRFRVRVGQQRRMHQRLVIDMLVYLARLYLAIQHQAGAEVAGAHDPGGLVRRPPLVEYLIETMKLDKALADFIS